MHIENNEEYYRVVDTAIGLWNVVFENGDIVSLVVDAEVANGVYHFGPQYVRELAEDSYNQRVLGVIDPYGNLITQF